MIEILKDFKSKKADHALQPMEIELIAHLAIIYEVMTGKKASKVDLLALWEAYNP